MFDKLNQIAESAATSVSRRQFLGQLGRGAMVLAAAAGGLLALPALTQAGPGGCGTGWHRCTGRCHRTCCPDGYYCCMKTSRGDRERYCSCC